MKSIFEVKLLVELDLWDLDLTGDIDGVGQHIKDAVDEYTDGCTILSVIERPKKNAES